MLDLPTPGGLPSVTDVMLSRRVFAYVNQHGIVWSSSNPGRLSMANK